MRIEQYVVAAWADRLSNQIIRKVMNDLRKINYSGMLSGDDSGLKNVWDEICVQVQDEESFYWDSYEETIEDLIAEEVKLLDPDELLALWCVTEQGWDYIYDHYTDDTGGVGVPVLQDDIVQKLKSGLLSVAAAYTNSRITRYSHKIHFLSLAGYAYANHRVPGLDYSSGVLAATKKLTRSDVEVEKAFRLMVFNVLAHNKDDHSKNFAYLFDPADGVWRLAPGYDLTFNTGMANQHTTSINGSGNPTLADIKKVATERKIKNWEAVLDDVRSAVDRWPEFADKHGMAKSRMSEIKRELTRVAKNCSS